MIIAITGQPGSGKSTLLEKAIADVDSKWGFFAKSIVEEGVREGFSLQSERGDEIVLASTSVPSGPKVSKYRVDLKALEEFLESMRDPKKGELVYLDEVGEMELYSDLMKPLVERWLDSSDNIILVISSVFSDPLIDSIRDQADLLIEVNKENREQLLKDLQTIIQNF